jgi:hypothetical protein
MCTLCFRRLPVLNWRHTIPMLVVCILLNGCLPAGESRTPPDWLYSDLRILAAPVDGEQLYQLVSLYTRKYRSDLQIRLDLWEYETQDEFDIYLAIDSHPGGSHQLPIDAQASLEWDLLLVVPSSGPLVAVEPGGNVAQGIRLRVARNPSLDTLTVSLDRETTGERFQIQAFITKRGHQELVSSLGPIRSDAHAHGRLPVTLAFWNTFPAYTPSQALRRMDGAHTGPSSDRHGLRGLMDAVESARFPALLLDLKSPAFLSALDYAGGMDRVKRLASQGLLILPDLYPKYQPVGSKHVNEDWIIGESAKVASQVREIFDLQPSPFLYTAARPSTWPADLPEEILHHRVIFYNPVSPEIQSIDQIVSIRDEGIPVVTPPGDLSPVVSRWQAYTWVDLSSTSQALIEQDQATYSGPSLEIRRALLEAAASSAGRSFVFLGGDLSQSSWGIPSAAYQTLNYLRSRPWVQPILPADLVSVSPFSVSGRGAEIIPVESETETGIFIPSSPDGAAIGSGLTVDQIQARLLEELSKVPENAASRLARQAYESLFAQPVLPHPVLVSLRANYLGQIGHLLAASRWEDNSIGEFCSSTKEQGLCITAQDLDWDGEQEYLLLSKDIFLLFEPRGGYLTTAFWRLPHGAVQIIAPSSQFVVGMGDPMSWDPGKGIAGDPGQYRGAFSDLPTGFSQPSWAPYHVEIGPDSLSFTAPDGSSRKSISISPDGFIVRYETSVPLTIQIPLAVDPALRFTPDWGTRYWSERLPLGWRWGIQDGVQVELQSLEDISFNAFTDSYEYMGQPEDPDFDFPPGHFLPFPLALAEISADGEFTIQIMVKP